ncbi:hypothetical protein BC835DRAFT_1304144 [Cytidiella melzeri]|nr:hypothetical protein BC835DRAFT_1304144 [Cytidiella melzeri]
MARLWYTKNRDQVRQSGLFGILTHMYASRETTLAIYQYKAVSSFVFGRNAESETVLLACVPRMGRNARLTPKIRWKPLSQLGKTWQSKDKETLMQICVHYGVCSRDVRTLKLIACLRCLPQKNARNQRFPAYLVYSLRTLRSSDHTAHLQAKVPAVQEKPLAIHGPIRPPAGQPPQFDAAHAETAHACDSRKKGERGKKNATRFTRRIDGIPLPLAKCLMLTTLELLPAASEGRNVLQRVLNLRQSGLSGAVAHTIHQTSGIEVRAGSDVWTLPYKVARAGLLLLSCPSGTVWNVLYGKDGSIIRQVEKVCVLRELPGNMFQRRSVSADETSGENNRDFGMKENLGEIPRW